MLGDHFGIRATNISGLFYASAFQAGINEFLLYDFKSEKRLTLPPFAHSRATYFKGSEKSHARWVQVDEIFSSYLPDGWKEDKNFKGVYETSHFLCEVLDAIDLKSSLLLTRSIPNLGEAQRHLPNELSVPLSTFLDSISKTHCAGLVPQSEISFDQIKRLQEILESTLFDRFSLAQQELDDSNIPSESALPAISKAADRILSKHRNILIRKEAAVGLLEITPRLVDAAFGRFPGALAELATRAAGNLLKSDRRLVIYDLGSIVRGAFSDDLKRATSVLTDQDKGSSSPE
jgi:hypothetical protein